MAGDDELATGEPPRLDAEPPSAVEQTVVLPPTPEPLLERIPDLPAAADLDLLALDLVAAEPTPDTVPEIGPEAGPDFALDLAGLDLVDAPDDGVADTPAAELPELPELPEQTRADETPVDAPADAPADAPPPDLPELPQALDTPQAEVIELSAEDFALEFEVPSDEILEAPPALDDELVMPELPDAEAPAPASLDEPADDIGVEAEPLAGLPAFEPVIETETETETETEPSRDREPRPTTVVAPDALPVLAEDGAAGDTVDATARATSRSRSSATCASPIPLFNIFLNEADEQSRRLGTELAEWALEPQRAGGRQRRSRWPIRWPATPPRSASPTCRCWRARSNMR